MNTAIELSPGLISPPAAKTTRTELGTTALWVSVSAAAFWAAFAFPHCQYLVLAYLLGLIRLACAPSWRKAFYPALAVGLLIACVHLGFFWRLFSGGAVVLWCVYAFWQGLFAALARLCILGAALPGRWRAGAWGWLLVPFIWCGLEYFRSELYYLRFSWLTPAFAFGGTPGTAPVAQIGVYGLGFLMAGIAAAGAWRWKCSRAQGVAILLGGAAVLRLWAAAVTDRLPGPPLSVLKVAGVQMEFPSLPEVISRLDDLATKAPDAQLLVLSEYTFMEPLPDKVKAWCRRRGKYLVVGHKQPAAGGRFYNTVSVISPQGEAVFSQVKSVPIQFFNDGLPAPQQRVWDSPWGKLGICICYDLSYSRVTDRLVRMGAEALIVPTMDVVDWGAKQHDLHARMAPLRATEYGLGIFRVASSGVSQLVDGRGAVLASAPFCGEGTLIAGSLPLKPPGGRVPPDRLLAHASVGVCGAVLLVALFSSRKKSA